MALEVYYGDDKGRITGKIVWDPTSCSVESGNLFVGQEYDWSDPDKGIFARRSYVQYRYDEGINEDEVGRVMDYLVEPCMIVSPAELQGALFVVVDGTPVLSAPTDGSEPEFECGLSLVSPDNGDPASASVGLEGGTDSLEGPPGVEEGNDTGVGDFEEDFTDDDL